MKNGDFYSQEGKWNGLWPRSRRLAFLLALLSVINAALR